VAGRFAIHTVDTGFRAWVWVRETVVLVAVGRAHFCVGQRQSSVGGLVRSSVCLEGQTVFCFAAVGQVGGYAGRQVGRYR